jgi:hypothetical protein
MVLSFLPWIFKTGVKMQDDLPAIEAVAEGLWQTKSGIDHLNFKSHFVWRDLPDLEKAPWRAEALRSTHIWKRSNG